MVIQASLVKASKHFSYAEHRTPKLFRSKSKKEYIEKLLKEDWKYELKRMIYSLSLQYYDSVYHLQFLTNGHENQVLFFGGVDSAYFQLEKQIPISFLITSPPYLQAQEYITAGWGRFHAPSRDGSPDESLSSRFPPRRKANQIL